MYAQFLLFDSFDPLDVVGPFEVPSAGSAAAGGDEATLELVSAEGVGRGPAGTHGLVLTASGVLDPAKPDI